MNRISRLKKILLHPHFLPIQIWPGTGILAISAYGYHGTSIGPYYEITIISLVLSFYATVQKILLLH
jgi:hypothetical protein